MWTGKDDTKEYTAQITPYHGYVNAEILCNHESFYNAQLGLYLTVMNKSFGSHFRKSPREKDWKNAQAWVDEQLKLIEAYGTVVVTKPQHLKDI